MMINMIIDREILSESIRCHLAKFIFLKSQAHSMKTTLTALNKQNICNSVTPSSDVHSHSPNQEIPHFLLNVNVHTTAQDFIMIPHPLARIIQFTSHTKLLYNPF